MVIEHAPVPPHLLRAHVAKRAQHAAAGCEIALGLDHGQAEVGHPKVLLGVDQEIRGLDVAVHDAHLVGVFQRVGRLNG